MAKVTFDGPTKTIIVDFGINVLNVREDLYSAWKVWVATGDNSKFLPAFRVVGGDPSVGSNIITPYFFLINGWRVRPFEGNHTLEIDGILIVDGGGDPFIDTIGTWRIGIQSIVPLKAETIVIDNTIPLDENAPTWDSSIGITSISQNGSDINITWGTATDDSGVLYQVYISDTLANIWENSSLLGVFPNNTKNIKTESDGTSSFRDITYYVGVRATDKFGNVTSNENSLMINYIAPVITSDNLTAQDIEAISTGVWDNVSRTLTNNDVNIISVNDQLVTIDDFKADVSIIDSKINAVQNTTDTINNKVQTLNNYDDSIINSKLNTIDGTVDRIETKLDTAALTLNAVNTAVSLLPQLADFRDEMINLNFGKLEIVNNRMLMYDQAGVLIVTYDLFDNNGNSTMSAVYRREVVNV